MHICWVVILRTPGASYAISKLCLQQELKKSVTSYNILFIANVRKYEFKQKILNIYLLEKNCFFTYKKNYRYLYKTAEKI